MRQERYKRERAVDGPPDDETASREKQLESIVCQEDGFEEEASYLAEKGTSDCLAKAGTVRSGRSAYRIMQAAKKLVLIDEFDREYKRLQKPAEAVAKTNKSVQLSNTLRDQSLPDDRKVREYLAALHKYLNVRKKLPAETEVKPNPLTLPPPAARPRRHRRRPQAWEPY